MNNIEELNIEYLKINARSVANGVAAISSKWAGETILALIAQLEAAQKELFDFHNQEFQQRLANAEHQLYMKDLAIHNIKASRKAQFRKRLAAEAALSAANEPWRSFVTNDDISALNRFAECCDDPESGGHDLDKDQVERLVSIGALRKTKRNYHETTDFGDFVISAGFTEEGNADAE
ncbi:hypothetical protein DVQ58_20785 [Yersinia enterocolitica]|nr:hypothetical protein [Yersinia enterocolitica]